MFRCIPLRFSTGLWPWMLVLGLVGPPHLGAQGTDCKELIEPPTETGRIRVGPEDCRIVESSVRNASGGIVSRLEVAISGTIEGFTPRHGTRSEMFTDAPEFALAQRGNRGPYYHGIGYYHAARGAGMTVFLPRSPDDWNGKLFILAHGSSSYPSIGELPPRRAGEYPLGTGANSYAAPMIDHGFAVAYTRRPAAGAVRPSDSTGEQQGEEVRLDDGTVLRDKTFGYHMGLLRDWTGIARNLVRTRLGRSPERIYWYGKSGGAALGRILNYRAGANRDHRGERLFDGMLINDAGGGWYWPVQRFRRVDLGPGVFSLEPREQDGLVVDQAFRDSFAHQIDIAHQNYTGANHIVGEYLYVKRENARLLREKGLASRNRMYEIAGVSHSDTGGPDQLDLGGVFDALILALDRWVVAGVEPSPTRSDAPYLGDADGDGQVENPAVQLPEMGCPTGIYVEYSQRAPQPGSTVFIPYLDRERPRINADVMKLPEGFDPDWLEPLDRRGYLVDMNGNGVRDTRETIEQAWQRRWRRGETYGTLEPGEPLTHARYVNCVARVASDLLEENLMSEAGLLYYIQAALRSPVGRPLPPAADQQISARD